MVHDLLLLKSEPGQMFHFFDGKDTIRRAREERSNSLVKGIRNRIHTSYIVLYPHLGIMFKNTQLMENSLNAGGDATIGMRRPPLQKPIVESWITKPRTIEFKWIVIRAPPLIPFEANRKVI